MKKIILMLCLISVILMGCGETSKTIVYDEESGQTITTETKITTETITVEDERGTNKITLDKVTKTAKLNTEYQINDTDESTEIELFGKIDMAPMMFNMFCGMMNMFMNETAMEDFEKSMEELGEGIGEFNAEFGTDEEEIQEEPKEESEIANVLEGYKVTEVNFKMTDFESGETIGECFIKKYNDINCKAYREYENPFFGMQMCDFSEE